MREQVRQPIGRRQKRTEDNIRTRGSTDADQLKQLPAPPSLPHDGPFEHGLPLLVLFLSFLRLKVLTVFLIDQGRFIRKMFHS